MCIRPPCHVRGLLFFNLVVCKNVLISIFWNSTSNCKDDMWAGVFLPSLNRGDFFLFWKKYITLTAHWTKCILNGTWQYSAEYQLSHSLSLSMCVHILKAQSLNKEMLRFKLVPFSWQCTWDYLTTQWMEKTDIGNSNYNWRMIKYITHNTYS